MVFGARKVEVILLGAYMHDSHDFALLPFATNISLPYSR